MDIAILLVTMFFCFFIGVPIAYSLALAAIAGALWIGIPLEAVMLKISDGVSKVAMLTIPFFVLAGAIMAEGGMARRLVAFADVLVGFTRVRGGLSVVNVLATTFLSGISGSAVADTSAIGSVMIPQMEKVGFPRVFATNVTITASVQALLVPPSHNAVIYSLATGGTISIISPVHGRRRARAPARLLPDRALPRHRLPRQPSARPDRAAARGGQDHHRRAVGPDHARHHSGRHSGRHIHRHRGRRGGLRLGLPGHHVRLSRLSLARSAALIHRTLRTVAMVMTLIACASSVGYVMALTQMPAKITAFFLTISSDKNVILLLINIMLLVLGCLLDMAPSILICTPILLPVMMNFGVNPVHFGIIMMLNLGIGLCHPPVGAILFVGCAVGKVTIEQVMRKIWPFYGVMLLVLMLVTYFPEISLWLPRLLGL